MEEEVAARSYSKNAHNKVFALVHVCVCYLFISRNVSFVPFNPGMFPVSFPAQ